MANNIEKQLKEISERLEQVVALHRRGAYPIRPVIRLEIIHR